jgi:SAM-dependent methyltransferase
MKRLTNEKYWDQIWRTKNQKKSNFWNFLVRKGKNFLGEKADNYSETALWSTLYPKYLPFQAGLKILEIGSAPGWNLVKFYRLFGYEPFGVEFSSVGAEKNRQKFISAGINPSNVIEADFFSPDFQDKFKEHFDIVISRGFIEHFDDSKKVLQDHLRLLKSGGTLIITVPNFQGLNYYLANFFYSGIKETHNFSILNRERLLRHFAGLEVETLHCNYQGTLGLGLFVLDNQSRIKYWIYRFLLRLQVIFNVLFNFIFGKKGAENRYFSPYIIYFGRKK